jgi:hypothetical protein
VKLTAAVKANRVPVLTVNGRPITKQQLVEKYRTGNWQAARRLRNAMAALGLRTAAELRDTHWEDLWDHGAGYMTLLVASHVIEKHFGGDTADAWIARQRTRKEA